MKNQLLAAVLALSGLFATSAIAQEWKPIPGSLQFVSAVDRTTAWGVNAAGSIYRTRDGGATWQQVPGALTQVSALSYDSAWGVNAQGAIYRTRNGGSDWEQRPGALRHVSAVGYDVAWGTNASHAIYRTRNAGSDWQQVPGALTQVSALSHDSAWGVNANDAIYAMSSANADAGQADGGTTHPGTRCADEGRFCFFSGPAEVHYGARGKWSKKLALNGIACRDAAFGGDPIPGVEKSCYFISAPQERLARTRSQDAPSTPRRIAFEQWIGTAPSCNASPRDCTDRGMEFVRRDDRGDGSECWTGTKVLCRGWRDAPTPQTADVWLGTAPACSASAQDCTRLGMTHVRSDKSGDGATCVTGSKVLCTAPKAATVREWVGTAPFCSASQDDCTRRGLRFVRSDKSGDGETCATGTKVLCQGSAADYKPQASGLTDTLNQVRSEVDLSAIAADLERKRNEILPLIEPRVRLAATHIRQIIASNPQAISRAQEAATRGDRSRVYDLFKLEELDRKLREPGIRRGEAPSRPRRWQLATRILPVPAAFGLARPASYTGDPGDRIQIGWGESGRRSPIPARSRSSSLQDRDGFRVAQSADKFTHRIFSFASSGGAGAGVGWSGGQGSLHRYGTSEFNDREFCQTTFVVGAVGGRLDVVRIGEWIGNPIDTDGDPDKGTNGDYHGWTPGGYLFLGMGLSVWFDYDGNHKGWVLRAGGGLTYDGFYSRTNISGC